MSKQAYQKYRKEKDKRQTGKTDNRASDLGKVISNEGKPDHKNGQQSRFEKAGASLAADRVLPPHR